MMFRHALAFLLALFISACGNKPATDTASAANLLWEGELRILPGDTTFVPCGTLRKLRITGLGLDSLAHRYAWLQTQPRQWIKTWCNGHLAAPKAGETDSVLIAAAYAHMDASVSCPPVAKANAAGRYKAEAAVPGGMHAEQLDLFPGGDATITTATPSMQAEVDGHWGINNDGQLVFEEKDKRYSFTYELGPQGLVRQLPNGNQVVYLHTGPADRLAGTYGRTARLLAEVATAHGNPFQPGDLRPDMRLDSLLPDSSSRNALRLAAGDTLGLNAQDLSSFWAATETVEDLVQLMRGHFQPRH